MQGHIGKQPERSANLLQVFATRTAQLQLARTPHEQRYAKLLLQQGDALADRTCGNAKLFTRAIERAQPRGSLEGPDRGKGWQPNIARVVGH